MSTQHSRAKPATREKYLWEKPGARFLWFRLWVPARYAEIEPRKIIQCCLGTRDRREASLKVALKRTELEKAWEAQLNPKAFTVAARIVPTLEQLQIAAAEAAYLEVGKRLTALLRNGATSADGYASLTDSLRAQRMRLVRTRAGAASHLWERVAQSQVAVRGWHLPGDHPNYSTFLSLIADAGIDALGVEIERREGRLDPEPSSDVVKAGLSARAVRAPAGETIMELFERYASQSLSLKRKRPDTINQDRKVLAQFADYVGCERALRLISKATVREWRDTVASLPRTYRKLNAYRGLGLKEAAAKARKEGIETLDPVTVNKYLSAVSPVFDWAVEEGYADQNPCDGLHYNLRSLRKRRPPFTPEQIRQIFSSPLFTGFKRDGKEHLPGDQRADDFRYWVPLLCLYTGARIGEVAQLRVDDVAQENEHWLLTLRDDETTGQRTKSGRSRCVPVHSQLQSLGFLGWVDRHREKAAGGENPQLFLELVPNDRDQLGARPSRFVRDYLKRIGLKAGRDGLGAHSFRHTTADRLRSAGYYDHQIAILLGHAQHSTTGRYGETPQGTTAMLVEMVESLQFEGLDPA